MKLALIFLLSLTVSAYSLSFQISAGSGFRTSVDKSNLFVETAVQVYPTDKLFGSLELHYNMSNQNYEINNTKPVVLKVGNANLAFPKFEMGFNFGYCFMQIQHLELSVSSGYLFGKFSFGENKWTNDLGQPIGSDETYNLAHSVPFNAQIRLPIGKMLFLHFKTGPILHIVKTHSGPTFASPAQDTYKTGITYSALLSAEVLLKKRNS